MQHSIFASVATEKLPSYLVYLRHISPAFPAKIALGNIKLSQKWKAVREKERWHGKNIGIHINVGTTVNQDFYYCGPKYCWQYEFLQVILFWLIKNQLISRSQNSYKYRGIHLYCVHLWMGKVSNLKPILHSTLTSITLFSSANWLWRGKFEIWSNVLI